jgi:tRNA(Ile)-lysidine synthase
MAMLAIASASLGGRVRVVTVDHGLRTGSTDETALVARWCDQQDIHCCTLQLTEPLVGPSLQAAARKARYSCISSWAVETGV